VNLDLEDLGIHVIADPNCPPGRVYLMPDEIGQLVLRMQKPMPPAETRRICQQLLDALNETNPKTLGLIRLTEEQRPSIRSCMAENPDGRTCSIETQHPTEGA